MVQDVDDCRGHRFVGIGEENADLPDLGVAELSFECGHAGEADAVFYLPIGFAHGIVADADDIRVIVMGFKQGRRIREHVFADGGRPAVEAVANCAAVHVDAGPGGQIGGIGLKVGANHLSFDPTIERHVDEPLFVRKSGVIDCNRNFPVGEVSQDRKGNKDHTDDQPKQESSHDVSQPPPNFILEYSGSG